MNCKPGDLAVQIKSNRGEHNIGSCVTVLEAGPPSLITGGPTWVTTPNRGGITWIADAHLRPLRDNPGQDETLTWLDVPSTTKETA